MALMPWLGHAATSIEKYSSIRKSCVFCFEAFLCRIACNDRTVVTARHLLPHLKQALERELRLRGALAVESHEDQDEGDKLCDAMSLGVATNVDGVECCSCKRLCHFSYFTSTCTNSPLPSQIFCPNCASASPTDSPLSLVERVRSFPTISSPPQNLSLRSIYTCADSPQCHSISRRAPRAISVFSCDLARQVRGPRQSRSSMFYVFQMGSNQAKRVDAAT